MDCADIEDVTVVGTVKCASVDPAIVEMRILGQQRESVVQNPTAGPSGVNNSNNNHDNEINDSTSTCSPPPFTSSTHRSSNVSLTSTSSDESPKKKKIKDLKSKNLYKKLFIKKFNKQLKTMKN